MLPVSVLDLSPINVGATIAESFAHSVELAQTAERLGYKRIWFAEHHNMSGIATAATSFPVWMIRLDESIVVENRIGIIP